MSDLTELLESSIAIFSCKTHGDVECEYFAWHKPYCPTCSEEAEKLEKQEAKKAHMKSRLLSCGVTPLFLPKRYADFDVTGNHAKQTALDEVKNYVKKFSSHSERGENLILAGSLGTGKTHLASCLAKELVYAGYYVKIDTLKNLIKKVRQTWKTDGDEDYVYSQFVELDLLIIDEVGRGKATEDAMDIACEIIDRRYNAIKPTVVLGNVNLDQMGDYLDPRGVDRLLEKGAVVVMDWESHRTAGAQS